MSRNAVMTYPGYIGYVKWRQKIVTMSMIMTCSFADRQTDRNTNIQPDSDDGGKRSGREIDE